MKDFSGYLTICLVIILLITQLVFGQTEKIELLVQARGRNAHAILSPFTLYDHIPKKILPDVTFIDAAAGECHSVALGVGSPTDLWAWGGNKHGELCMKAYPEIGEPKNLTDTLIGYGNTYNIPELKYLNTRNADGTGYQYYISVVAVSYINTFFVVHGQNKDTLFGCGESSSGLLRQRMDLNAQAKERITYPQIFHEYEGRIKRLECGDSFCLFLTESGDVYSWGSNELGQIDPFLVSSNNIFFFPHQSIQIKALCPKIEEVKVGASHLALTCPSQSLVVLIGNNMFYTLGNPVQTQRTYVYSYDRKLHEISISCGADHTVLLRKTIPKNVTLASSWNLYANEDYFAPFSSYSAAASVNNEIMEISAWGNNLNGQFGVGIRHESTSDKSVIPVLPSGYTPYQVAAGFKATFVFTRKAGTNMNETVIFAAGRNNNLIIGKPSTNDQTILRKIETSFPGTIKEFSNKKNHVLLLDGNGNLWTWGSNVYGQLGRDVANNLLCLESGDANTVIGDEIMRALFNIDFTKANATEVKNYYSNFKFACGQSTIGAYTSDNKAGLFGHNYMGALGETEEKSIPITQPVKYNYNKISLAPAFLTVGFNEKGLESFGTNDYGTLGLGYDLSTFVSWDSDFLLGSSSINKYFFVSNNFRNQPSSVFIDSVIEGKSKIVDVFNAFLQTFVVLENKSGIQKQSILTFGKCNDGNIGRSYETVKDCWRPVECCSEIFERSKKILPDGTAVYAKVKKIAIGSDHFLVLLDNGQAFGLGSDEKYQMGLGRNYDVLEKIGIVNGTNGITGVPLNENIVGFACGWTHSVFVSQKNIFTLGGRVNVGREFISSCDKLKEVNTNYETFVDKNNENTQLVGTVAGQTQTFFLNKNGEVFRFKTLGEDTTSKSFVSFENNENASKNITFVSISMRNEHVLLISNEKKLYVIGSSNQFGELGTGSYLPKANCYGIIKDLENYNFTLAEAGVYHSLAVTTNNELFVWGRNMEGQIAPSANGTIIESPQKVFEFNEKVKSISTFVDHSLVVTESGKVYSFGSEKEARIYLGRTCTKNECSTPTQIPFFASIKVIHAVAGYYLSVFVDSDGNIWRSGYNSNGGYSGITQMKFNNPTDGKEYTKFDVLKITCGAAHCVFQDRTLGILSFGAGSFGKLGWGECSYVSEFNPIEYSANYIQKPLISVGATEYASFALDVDGELWFWGKQPFASSINLDYYTFGPQIVNKPERAKVMYPNNELLQMAKFDQLECASSFCLAVDSKQDIKCGWGKNDFNRMGFDKKLTGWLFFNCTTFNVPEPPTPTTPGAIQTVTFQGLAVCSYSSILLFNSVTRTPATPKPVPILTPWGQIYVWIGVISTVMVVLVLCALCFIGLPLCCCGGCVTTVLAFFICRRLYKGQRKLKELRIKLDTVDQVLQENTRLTMQLPLFDGKSLDDDFDDE